MFTGKVRSYDREKTKKKTWKPYFSDYADFDDCARKRSFGLQHDLGCWKPAACSGEAGKPTGESCGRGTRGVKRFGECTFGKGLGEI